MNNMLVVAFAVAALFALGVTVAGILFVRRRYHVEWKYLGYGALVFLLFQVVTRIPAVTVLQGMLAGQLQSSATFRYTWIAGLALTAGLFEEIGRYLGYRYLFKNGKTWQNALMYGLGHGGLEAVLLGTGGMLLTVMNYIVISNMAAAPAQIPAGQAEQIAQAQAAFAALQWWTPLLGGFERLGALVIQVSLSVVVLQSFLRGTKLWLYGAIGYHALVDFASVIMAMQLGPVAAELLVAVFALIGVYVIWAFRPKSSQDVVEATIA